MPAYVNLKVDDFLAIPPTDLLGKLELGYSEDGFHSQYVAQTSAWIKTIPLLKKELGTLVSVRAEAASWHVLFEFPIYRLRRRIDVVVLTASIVFVIELKVGESLFHSADKRQVEEYCLDLRDFHSGSHSVPIVPILWCSDAEGSPINAAVEAFTDVAPVHLVGKTGLATILDQYGEQSPHTTIDPSAWNSAGYHPVPTIVEAATSIFAGHDVREIARADATNLNEAAKRLVELVSLARDQNKKALIFLTGVPGSGKTLAGLQAVHDAIATGKEAEGDIVYLSGNTPLVTVLREALAQDEHNRLGTRLDDIRRKVRTRIQHINDFLKDALDNPHATPPHEHAIVFDEAQRAWDLDQGKKKFDRNASEPELILEIMGRHSTWCACICLIGGGQEINSGEEGVLGWGKALERLDHGKRSQWHVFAPNEVLTSGATTGGLSLGELPVGIKFTQDDKLKLDVPIRSYRSPRLSEWVDAVLGGNSAHARSLASELDYPLVLTRSSAAAKAWLRSSGRGLRRYGLLASSGAKRLRAEGFGVTLSALDGMEIAHWYLKPVEDIRASYALEVPANEYTCQGLELDFAAVCWDGDMMWDAENSRWMIRRLSGPTWQQVGDSVRQQHARNSYRVLMTRAREGLAIWVPVGDESDRTRNPKQYQDTADFLEACGAKLI